MLSRPATTREIAKRDGFMILIGDINYQIAPFITAPKPNCVSIGNSSNTCRMSQGMLHHNYATKGHDHAYACRISCPYKRNLAISIPSLQHANQFGFQTGTHPAPGG
jgi:hypothetical protein